MFHRKNFEIFKKCNYISRLLSLHVFTTQELCCEEGILIPCHSNCQKENCSILLEGACGPRLVYAKLDGIENDEHREVMKRNSTL